MEVEEAIRTRRSIRHFSKREIPLEWVKEIIELGNLAPSAGNLQARDFVVVTDEKKKRKIANAALNQNFIAEAPIVIVVCANYDRIAPYGERGKELYVLHDTGAAIQNVLLAVHARNLGAVWVGAFREEPVASILGLPNHIRPVAVIPIGFPAEAPSHRRRRSLEEIIHYEGW